ncbi:DNA-binding transcriptional regulator OxyR [Actinobacillus equuli]|nr:DNA-binding transcriptional regulator OxyR [Actinobacillus equuli]
MGCSKRLRYQCIKDKELLFLDDGHCLRTQTLDYCLSVGAKESTHFKATNLETLRNMVAANAGISLIPELAAKPCDGLKYLTFNDPKPYRSVGLIYRPGSPLRLRYERLAKEVSNIMKQENINE